jgi:hypothetical protein
MQGCIINELECDAFTENTGGWGPLSKFCPRGQYKGQDELIREEFQNPGDRVKTPPNELEDIWFASEATQG